MTPAPRVRQRPLVQAADELPAGLHPVLRRVLLARGVSTEAACSMAMSGLLNPSGLSGISAAAALLADAVESEARILVVGDFDADGATGTALALLALKAMGCSNLSFRVPNRFEYGYGLTVGLVETLADDPPDLLVTVDSGISCVPGVQRARELGCSVIVTDHHLPGEQLPAADAIVNPNTHGDGFDSKALAGVGVMFYLLSALRAELRSRGWFDHRPQPVLANYLDLVALGTVADLVPLDHNNRILVRQGLERIRRGQARPGLLALLRLGKRDYRYVSSSDLGFTVGPRLNAAGRLEDMGTGIECLLCEDPDQAMAMAEELDALNQQRKGMQQAMQDQARLQLDHLIAGLEDSAELPEAVCLYDADWHQGIVGLVASRIKDSVHRPVIAFAPEEAGSTVLKGSARSVRGLHIRDVLARVDAQHPGMIRAFGGHAMAAGLTLESTRYEEFREALLSAIRQILDGESLVSEHLTDGELEPGEFNLPLARDLENLGPWGQRFPEPLFEGSFRVIDSRVVGGAHLKMIVQAVGGGPELDAIAFNYLPEDLPRQGAVRLLYHLSVNRWRGQESCQLMVSRILG